VLWNGTHVATIAQRSVFLKSTIQCFWKPVRRKQ